MRKYIGLVSLFFGIGLLIIITYINSPFYQTVRVFSPYTLLTSSWENYKIRFISPDGRVIDYSQEAVTTSEGQSYALLQSVWMDDKPTFDKVWSWTKTNLKRPNDNLFGWRWGQISDGKYGLLPNGGNNTASDADTDIALALILASRRWENIDYLNAALPIINDIWNVDTAVVSNNRYLTAGNWANAPDRMVINLSYFSPYAWHLFGSYDKKHDWEGMIGPAYILLNKATASNLDKSSSANLPPDWIAVNKKTGVIITANLNNLTTNYSYDAIRIPWRIAIDYLWNDRPDAKNYLQSLNYLSTTYNTNKVLPNSFAHDGQILSHHEDPAMYATTLGYFMVTDPDQAHNIYQQKILKLYSNSTNSFQNNLPYYQTNWLWFGTALYLHYLVPF